ncbi:GbsR/MarR family transcriptional regulator [Flavobacterium antarcticum]|uniref:GbsR/MarR family transcriptional regulator n=1 Tax=Flavobacterium antarcticum TaxID=271155 RepID=UPI0003B57A44|nr:helix-turn-helix domain-containing protein [Flavobacterium antarcticum]
MEKLSNENILLIEDIGLALEERADLSPLSARIYSTLILSSDEGLTFEDIVTMHHASKSSVSNNLNVLIKLKYIEYYTKTGQRKRFYRASRFYVKSAMEKYNQMFEKEIEVLEKINSFNKINNPERFESERYMGTIYQKHLIDTTEEFRRKIREISVLDN